MAHLSLDFQVQVILKMLGGANVCLLSREYGVSRQSLHTWRNIALQAIKESLSPKKRGRKPEPEVAKMKRTIANLERTIETLQSPLSFPESRLKERFGKFKCPKCGSSIIWKNGPYTLKSGERVERYVCRKCKKRLLPPKEQVSSI